MKNNALPLVLVLISMLLNGCSFFSEKEPQVDESWTAERLYSEAKAALDLGEYANAITYYEQLEARFPFGIYAQQALLESAYAYYKSDDPDAAVATLDRFMRVYPLNENMDYAYYLRGMTNLNRNIGLLEKYIPRDESQRASGSAADALLDFSTLVKRYPDSRYSEDATQRIVYLRNRLAQHEVNVANYYVRRGAFLAAANRGKYVLENYPRTQAVPEALLIMAKSYKILELNTLSDDALRVMELNYPGHPGIAEVRQLQLEPSSEPIIPWLWW